MLTVQARKEEFFSLPVGGSCTACSWNIRLVVCPEINGQVQLEIPSVCRSWFLLVTLSLCLQKDICSMRSAYVDILASI